MGFSNAMRFKYLGLTATFWVLSSASGEDEKKGGSQPEIFNTITVNNFNLTGPSNYMLDIITQNSHISNTSLFLCQATPNGGNIPNITASRIGVYCIGDASETCAISLDKDPTTSNPTGKITNENHSYFPFTLSQGPVNQSYFFLCFTDFGGSCGWTSKALILPGQTTNLPSDAPTPADIVKEVNFKPSENRPNGNPSVLALGAAALPSSTPPMATVTAASNPGSSSSPTSDDTTAASAPNPNSGLTTGAKAGIAVGALGVVVIILLAALLCLRKRHRRASAPDQIMLNQSSADSHDLITEKETERNSPQSYEAPTPVYGASLNVSPKSQTRHSALAPYEEIPSQPYTGSAAAIPRRKPTLSPKSTSTSSSTNQATAAIVAAATGATASSSKTPPAISREVSAASTIGPPSRNTPPTTNESSPPTIRDFEEYRDVPTTYADRHTPQVFGGGLQAPFLGSESNVSRESMSEADLARLTEEEEERRIDAAIEEAERKRRP